MVLHNNKWDRRAKSKYLKKHGITTDELKKQQQEKSNKSSNALIDQQRSEGKANIGLVEKSELPGEHHFDDNHINLNSDGEEHEEHEEEEEEEEEKDEEGQVDVFPEYEEDPEQTRLIRQHIALSSKNEETKPHIQHADKSVFEQAQAGVERSKLNQRVRRIGNKVKANNSNIAEIDSDSDFDDFMDKLDEEEDARSRDRSKLDMTDRSHSNIGVPSSIKSRQQFLDKLLN